MAYLKIINGADKFTLNFNWVTTLLFLMDGKNYLSGDDTYLELEVSNRINLFKFLPIHIWIKSI